MNDQANLGNETEEEQDRPPWILLHLEHSKAGQNAGLKTVINSNQYLKDLSFWVTDNDYLPARL